jgi:hypothetical protein
MAEKEMIDVAGETASQRTRREQPLSSTYLLTAVAALDESSGTALTLPRPVIRRFQSLAELRRVRTSRVLVFGAGKRV